MSEPYDLLAIDPGSEKSKFLWCRVTPPGEWALPFGVLPRHLVEIDNATPFDEIVGGFPRESSVGRFQVACEVLPGLFGGTSGSDQLRADQWAHLFVGYLRGHIPFGVEVPDGWAVFRATSRSMITGNATAKDKDVRLALIDIYGGKKAAVGGGRCKTCKKPGGWLGRPRRDCENCKTGHGDTGFESPRGIFHNWVGSHGFAALAVAIVAAQRIGAAG